MPQFYSTAAEELKRKYDAFTGGYLYALYFTCTGPDDEASPDDKLEPFFLEECVAVCKDFQESFEAALSKAYENHWYTQEQAGMDFWYTRNGHGCGFWDRGLGPVGTELTSFAKPYGETWPQFELEGEKR